MVKTMFVKIQGWSTPRRLVVEGNRVLFEVAFKHEYPGLMGQERMDMVRNRFTFLKNATFVTRKFSDYWGRSVYVSLPLPADCKDVVQYVLKTLRLKEGWG